MSITVGLDFGTHQTKICVEDSTDSLNKTYRFITFKDNDGRDTLFLPSIVQINDDDTVSYGFVDESRCKIQEVIATPKPRLSDYGSFTNPPIPQKKTAEYPSKPTLHDRSKVIESQKKSRSLLNSILNGTSSNKQLRERYNENLNINKSEQYKIEMRQWHAKCKLIDAEKLAYEKFCNNIIKYNKQYDRYKIALTEWAESQKPKRSSFRYFKIPTLINITDSWNHEISYDYISIWYIANILYLLHEMYGHNIAVQIGIPVTYSESGKYRNNAYRLLLSAYDLVENKFDSKTDFFRATYLELMDKTELNPLCDKEIVSTYGIAAIPEAYASLRAVTSRGKLSGMHLLVDIGGGTTDIAFFTVDKPKSFAIKIESMPDIHKIESMPKGLNFILKQYSIDHMVSMALAQDLFYVGDDGFDDYIDMYKSSLKEYVNNLILQIAKEFIKDNPGKGNIVYSALKGRCIIYCGGGGINESLYMDCGEYFNDIRLLDINMLDVDRVINNIEDKLYPILSTAYGLSIGLEGRDKDVIHLTPFSNTFDKVKIHANDSVSERNDDI